MSKSIIYSKPVGQGIKDYPLNSEGSFLLGLPGVPSYSNHTSLPDDNYWKRHAPKNFPAELLNDPAFSHWKWSSVNRINFDQIFKEITTLKDVRPGAKIVNLRGNKTRNVTNSRHLHTAWSDSSLVMQVRQQKEKGSAKIRSFITAKQNIAIPISDYYQGPGWRYGAYNATVDMEGPGSSMSQSWYTCIYMSDFPDNMLGTW